MSLLPKFLLQAFCAGVLALVAIPGPSVSRPQPSVNNKVNRLGVRDERLHAALQSLLRTGDIPRPDKAQGVAAAIKRASSVYNIPISYLMAMMDLESKFDMSARSHMGAIGLAQVMPATARTMDQTGWAPGSPDALMEPETSVLFGAAYLAYLRRNYGNWGAVFTVYNMGPGNYLLHQAETEDGIVVNDYALAVQHAQTRWERYLNGTGPAPFRIVVNE